MPIKCVFFDFDQVVRMWEHEFDDLYECTGIPLDSFVDVAFVPSGYEAAIRGEETSESWREGIGRVLAEQFPIENVESALRFWKSKNGALNTEVLELVRTCRDSVRVALFTNATSSLNREIESLGLIDTFDHIVNTSDFGSIKPEAEIYTVALSAVGIDPHEAFFTDDRVENVEAATKLGWHGHVFKDPSGLRTALVDVGVL
jgi:putative hydrolase of the HAD superfamily